MGSAVKRPAGFALPDAAPLFEEEGDAGFAALVTDVADPLDVHRTGAVPAFATNDYPRNAAKVELAEVF